MRLNENSPDMSMPRSRRNIGLAVRSALISGKQLFTGSGELDVTHVFRIFSAVGQSYDQGTISRLLKRDPGLPELLLRKPPLGEALRPKEKFLDYPKNSMGYAYGRYMAQERLDADVLHDFSKGFDQRALQNPEFAFLFKRIVDLHDVWHPLAGYGADLGGEIGILSFTLGFLNYQGLAALMGSVFVVGPVLLPKHRLGIQPFMIEAWRRGRRARNLISAPWETLMERPLADVQRELNVLPSSVAHPDGIYYWHGRQRKVRRIPGTEMQYIQPQ